MKIVHIKAGQEFSTQQPHIRIYPYITQEQDTVIDDPESEWYGESMGYVAAFEDRIELNYGWEDMPTWGVDEAEAFAHAILKAIEFSREMQASAANGGLGANMDDYINFDMCVNDDNGNGQHTGKLAAAHLRVFGDSDTFLNLSCTGREITCRRLDNKHIRVGRRTFPIVGYRAYVGNMRWDSAVVTVETANAIADVLRISGKYEPESGTAELWDRWEAGKPLFCS